VFEYEFSNESILLPYKNSTFDIAVSCGVLEHVREFGGDDVASLKELYRVLRKNGHLVITHLPTSGSWIEATNRKLGRSHHTYTYEKNEIIEKVTSSGFKIILHERYGLIPKNSLALISRRFDDKSTLVNSTVNTLYKLDKYVSKILPYFCQNHFLVLRKE